MTSVRQTDAKGQPLPFTTDFADRWNKNNDGTTFEPCTALNDQELISLHLEPDSVEDIALANAQTARGCSWDRADQNLSGVSISVGDSPKFELRRELSRQDGSARPSAKINGREVLVESHDQYSCITDVQVQDSVATVIVGMVSDAPPVDEICDYALEFTRVAISKMPT